MTQLPRFTLLLAVMACGAPAPRSAAPPPRPNLEPCSPLRPTPEDWPAFTIEGSPSITLRLPQNVSRDSADHSFALDDTGSDHGRASLRVETTGATSHAATSRQFRDSLTYIDGIPVTAGPRGTIERKCTFRINGRQSVVTFRRYSSWSDTYSFRVEVPLARGHRLMLSGEASTMTLRDSLVLVLPTVRIGAS